MSDNKLFDKRVYGVQIIKSKNSNYNADFTGSPRTLPDGTVYSTDKVDKFNIRKYLAKNNSDDIFVKESIHSVIKTKDGKEETKTGPRTLAETYAFFFCKEGQQTLKLQTKPEVLKNLLTKIDIRLFGATFAPGGDDAKGKNISIHGPVQISYGINRFEDLKDSGMYTDQIGSPYASDSGDSQSTLGTQTRSQEAHYIHHFSINPKNLSSYISQFQDNDQNKQEESANDNKGDFQLLSETDIQLLKESMAVATTYYDSTSKKDSENELLLWIELNKGSEKVFKNFTDLIKVENDTIFIKDVFTKYIGNHADAISKIELAYDKYNTKLDFDYKNDQDISFKDGVTSKFKCKIVHTDNIENISKETSETKDSETKDKTVPFIIYEDLNFVKSTYDILNKLKDENK